MKVYVIGNLKGGVGKTTTTVNLAYTYAEMGGRTLVIDLDPQCNCTRFFAKVNEYNKTIKDVLEAPEHINSAIYRTKYSTGINRQAWIGNLSTKDMAQYLSRNLSVSTLKSPDQLFNWLSDIVDNDGRFLEEGNQVR